MSFLNSLKAERRTLWDQSHEVLLKAAAEGRELRASESRLYTAGMRDLADIDERIEVAEKGESRALQADEIRSRNSATRVGGGAWQERGDNAELHEERGKAALGNGGRRTGDYGYSRSFTETRALALGANGPSAVPVQFADFVAVYQRTLNPTYGLATVIQSPNGENLTIPRLTADLTDYKPGEATAITESTPTLTSVSLQVISYKSLSYVSQEFAQDQQVDISGLIAKSAAREIGLDAGTDFTTGANGFITLGSNGGTALGTAGPGGSIDAAFNFFGPTDLINLFYSAAAPYRAFGSWQMSTDAITRTRKFRSTTGEFLWTDASDSAQLAQGAAGTLLGRPVYENPAMAATASATKSVAFGDFSAYIIKEVVPIRVEASTEFLFNLDQVAYKTVWRAGGTLPDQQAIRFMVSANT